MTQTEFAELFELKRTALGSYEEGRAEAKPDTLIKIVEHFGISLDQLLRKEITVNEIFHFPDTDKGDDVFFIDSAEISDYLKKTDEFNFKAKARRINSALFHHSASAAFILPFSGTILNTQVRASDILFLSEMQNKHKLFVGIYKEKLCLGSYQKGNCQIITADDSDNISDLSAVKYKKSVVQVLHSFVFK